MSGQLNVFDCYLVTGSVGRVVLLEMVVMVYTWFFLVSSIIQLDGIIQIITDCLSKLAAIIIIN